MGLSAKTGASAKWPLGLSMPSPLAKTLRKRALCALQSSEMLQATSRAGLLLVASLDTQSLGGTPDSLN